MRRNKSFLDNPFGSVITIGQNLLDNTRESIDSFINEKMVKTDILETEKEYVFKMDFPGVKKEDIKVSLTHNIDKDEKVLTIQAERCCEEPCDCDECDYFSEETDDVCKNCDNVKKEYTNVIKTERYFGSYIRSFVVDERTTEEDIHASLENGVLSVSIKKYEDDKEDNVKTSDIKIE